MSIERAIKRLFSRFSSQYFQVNRLNSKKKEAKVPLPPSFGYDIDDSGDEEEDGPPGMAPLKKLPALKFDQPFSKVEEIIGFNIPDYF